MIISTEQYDFPDIEALCWTLWYDHWNFELHTFDEYLTTKMRELYEGEYRCETFMRLTDIQKLKIGVKLHFENDNEACVWLLRYLK